MLHSKNATLYAYIALASIWLYTFYFSVLNPPFFGYFTVDETYIADSGIFLWYGNTPRCLDWPATPSLLSFFILFGFQVLWDTLQNLGELTGIFDLFERFDLAAYSYFIARTEFILIGRSIQFFLVGICLVFTVRFLLTRSDTLLTNQSRLIVVFLIITSRFVWLNIPVLRPEALAGGLFVLVLVQLLFSETFTRKDCYFLAVLFGIILAERLLFVFMAPLVLGAMYLKLPAQKGKVVLYAFFIILGVFILLCPFLLTDPLVVLKAFFGGILAKMQDKPMETFFNVPYIQAYFSHPINFMVLALAILGSWDLLKKRRNIAILLIGNWILFLVMVLHSAKIYDTHVLPVSVITVIACGLGINYIATFFKNRQGPVAIGLVVVLASVNLFEFHDFQKGSHRVSNMEKAYHWVNTLPANTRLLVNPQLEFYLPKNKAMLLRELEQNRDTLKMIEKLNFLIGAKGNEALTSDQLPYIAHSFAFEDERLYEVQYQLLLKYSSVSPIKKFDYDVYFDSTVLANHSVETSKAIEDFRNGKYEYMVMDQKPEGLVPIEEFSNGTEPTIYCFQYVSPTQ